MIKMMEKYNMYGNEYECNKKTLENITYFAKAIIQFAEDGLIPKGNTYRQAKQVLE